MGNFAFEGLELMTYEEKAKKFKDEHKIDPFEKYFHQTESRLDGICAFMTGLEQRIDYFKNHPNATLEEIRDELKQTRENMEKIKSLHENIFSEYQKITEEIKKIWQYLKFH